VRGLSLFLERSECSWIVTELLEIVDRLTWIFCCLREIEIDKAFCSEAVALPEEIAAEEVHHIVGDCFAIRRFVELTELSTIQDTISIAIESSENLGEHSSEFVSEHSVFDQCIHVCVLVSISMHFSVAMTH
jgi:hypothetical protein